MKKFNSRGKGRETDSFRNSMTESSKIVLVICQYGDSELVKVFFRQWESGEKVPSCLNIETRKKNVCLLLILILKRKNHGLVSSLRFSVLNTKMRSPYALRHLPHVYLKRYSRLNKDYSKRQSYKYYLRTT